MNFSPIFKGLLVFVFCMSFAIVVRFAIDPLSYHCFVIDGKLEKDTVGLQHCDKDGRRTIWKTTTKLDN